MENRRIISSKDLKERLENELVKFNFIYKTDTNAKDDPFTVTAYINPKLCEGYNDIKNFLNAINNKEDSANCTIIETNAIRNIRHAYNDKQDFRYLLGAEELKTLLHSSYNLPKNKCIDKITKVHEDIHIVIEELAHISS